MGQSQQAQDFYPRPPRGGRPEVVNAYALPPSFLSTPSARRATRKNTGRRRNILQFLSTPSARRATPKHHAESRTDLDFYPRPPRGGRLSYLCGFIHELIISIHALREEGDWQRRDARRYPAVFLSTPSARRATAGHRRRHPRLYHFYPRPPRGGRRRRKILP